MTTTTDLSSFGIREREEAIKLLQAMNADGLPNDFEQEEVQLMMNQNSGNVFFTNSSYQAALLNGEKIELFHNLPESGKEGFILDLINENAPDELKPDDVQYLKTAFGNQDIVALSDLPEAWQKVMEAE